MKKYKIAIIGANDFQNQLILKAKSLGIETHVFAWECGDVGEKEADFFYPISIVEKELILQKCQEIGIDGICSIASDLAVVTVNYVSEKMGLNGNSTASTGICTNKFQMRKAFKDAGVLTPAFLRVNSADEIDIAKISFPLIVKPTDRSGSRAITKIYEPAELPDAISSAVEASFEKQAIVEEFIDGHEYSCECISYRGEHKFLAFTKKFTTGEPHFIETGHREPSDIPEQLQNAIIKEIFKALTSLKIENGASHSEFKIKDDGTIGIIEIGARMGGDCIGSDLVMLSTGYDFLKMVLDVALDKAPDFTKVCQPMDAEIRFLFTQNDLDVLKQVQEDKSVSIHRISDINLENLGKITDSSNRIGYYILKK